VGPPLVVGAAAVVVALIIGFASTRVNSAYLSNHPYYGDTASYDYFHVVSYFRAERNGVLAELREQLTNNGRNPIRILPHLIVGRELLVHPNGHLVVATGMLAIFLAILGWTVYLRSGSVPYAVASIAVVLTANSTLEPIYGHGGNYPDLHAAYMVGSALCCLINSREGKDKKWLVLFGVFASASTLARFIAAGWTLITCGLVLVWYLYRRLREDPRPLRSVLVRVGCVAAPIVLLAGNYLLLHTQENLLFYRVTGYPFYSSLDQSVSSTLIAYRMYLGPVGSVVLVLVGIFYCAMFWHQRDRRSQWTDLFTSLAPPLIYLAFIIFVLNVKDDPLQPLYALPALYVLALAPFTVTRRGAAVRFGWLPAIALSAVFGFICSTNYGLIVDKYSRPTTYELADLKFQRDLTHVILNTSGLLDPAAPAPVRAPSFETYFYEYGRSVVDEAAYRYRRELNWVHNFEALASSWRLAYGTQPVDAIRESVYRGALERADFAAVMPNTGAPDASILFGSDVSRDVARAIYERIAAEPTQWRLITPLDSPWGRIEVYQNLTRPPARSVSP
jgi:hypothetical protein